MASHYDDLCQKANEGMDQQRKCGSGHYSFPDLEDTLCDWTVERRVRCLVVRRGDVQAFAFEMFLYMNEVNLEQDNRRTVKNALQAAYLDQNSSFEESYTAKH